jgi:uncharacterized coiled-coil protein SlyX
MATKKPAAKKPAKSAAKTAVTSDASDVTLTADVETEPVMSPSPRAIPSIDIDAITQDLAAMQARFGAAVSHLSAQQTAEATHLADLREQAAGTVTLLRDLHGINEITDATLPALVREYEEKRTQNQKAAADKNATLERERTDAQKAWAKELAEHVRLVKERDDAAQKAQKRDSDEYNYELARVRKAEADQDAQVAKQAQLAQDELKEARERAWADREKDVAGREKQVADVKARFVELPTLRSDALKRARGEGVSIATGQARVKADLLAKEFEGEKRMAELRIKSLSDTIAEQLGRIDAMNKQLAAALKQGQELAVKAIEGASNASSFIAVKEIAMEQAKNQPKGK